MTCLKGVNLSFPVECMALDFAVLFASIMPMLQQVVVQKPRQSQMNLIQT